MFLKLIDCRGLLVLIVLNGIFGELGCVGCGELLCEFFFCCWRCCWRLLFCEVFGSDVRLGGCVWEMLWWVEVMCWDLFKFSVMFMICVELMLIVWGCIGEGVVWFEFELWLVFNVVCWDMFLEEFKEVWLVDIGGLLGFKDEVLLDGVESWFCLGVWGMVFDFFGGMFWDWCWLFWFWIVVIVLWSRNVLLDGCFFFCFDWIFLFGRLVIVVWWVLVGLIFEDMCECLVDVVFWRFLVMFDLFVL